MTDYRPIFARNIKAMRKARGLSQEALALEAGIDRTYISGIERAIRNPSLALMGTLADCLKCDLSTLLQSDD